MEYYNKVIESVHVRFLKASNYKIDKPIAVQDYQEQDNALILLHHGTLKFGDDQEVVNEGEVIFLPKGQKKLITFGSGTKRLEISSENFSENRRKYLQSISFKDIKATDDDCISIINFESKVFDVVNFFNSLDIPPFIIRFNDRIAILMEDIMKETEISNVGKERSLKAQTEVLVIELLRHILKNVGTPCRLHPVISAQKGKLLGLLPARRRRARHTDAAQRPTCGAGLPGGPAIGGRADP